MMNEKQHALSFFIHPFFFILSILSILLNLTQGSRGALSPGRAFESRGDEHADGD
jgi:hypothetical protein